MDLCCTGKNSVAARGLGGGHAGRCQQDGCEVLRVGEPDDKPDSQVPVAFQLTYDDGMVEARGRYSVRAVIRVGDEVLWRSTQSFPALTQ